jgi:hypothetical protein
MTHDRDKPARYSITDTRRAREALDNSRQANKSWADRRRAMRQSVEKTDGWKRETHRLPREDARLLAKDYLTKYPKAAYWSEVESWRVLDNDVIEFTLRRLPSAD